MKYAPFEQLELTLKPIGVIRTAMRTKFDSPHQPTQCQEEQSIIELRSGANFHLGLQDLESFDRIWIIWWFHKNSSWRPLALPPRGQAKRRGVFATRSPYRPNPIGITCVPLLAVKKRTLLIGSSDIVDGTPILDIKPYIPTVDSFPDASLGWLSEVERELAQEARFTVTVAQLAEEQLRWLKERWQLDFIEKAQKLLARDPSPHRTRRIKRYNSELYEIGCGPWRAVFSIHDDTVTITKIVSGYAPSVLYMNQSEWVPDQEAQIAFREKWPDP
jgi:tRNA-Thr(GGU) m(6)t(6)A37 methyltransferase TsaA